MVALRLSLPPHLCTASVVRTSAFLHQHLSTATLPAGPGLLPNRPGSAMVLQDGLSDGLDGIPGSAVQGVLQKLHGRDQAAARLVCRGWLSASTSAAPSLTLRLAPTTTRSHLQQWLHHTRRFAHVPCVRIIVSGALPEAVLRDAVDVLAQRGGLYHLHVQRASPGDSLHLAPFFKPSNASITSWAPLSGLPRTLRTFAHHDVLVLAPDLDHLAPFSQHLAQLSLVNFGSSYHAPAAQLLASIGRTFKQLQQLTLQLPTDVAAPPAPPTAAGFGAAAAAAAAGPALSRVQSAHPCSPHEVLAAAQQMKQLQQLVLLDLPEPSATPHTGGYHSFAPTDNTNPTTTSSSRRPHIGSLHELGHQLLLLAAPGVTHLQLATCSGTSLTWTTAAAESALGTHQQGPAPGAAAAAGGGGGVVGQQLLLPTNIHLTCNFCNNNSSSSTTGATARSATATTAAAAGDGAKCDDELLEQLLTQLERYSPTADLLLPKLQRLHLTITAQDVAGLQPFTRRLTKLSGLRLTIMSARQQQFDLQQLMEALAQLQQLKDLVLLPGLGAVSASDLLQPLLTQREADGKAVAQQLQRLRIVAHLTGATSSPAAGSTASAGGGDLAALHQFQVLEALELHQLGSDLLQVPTSFLPPRLNHLSLRRGVLLERGPAPPPPAAAGVAGSAGADVCHPQLQSLALVDSKLPQAAVLQQYPLKALQLVNTQVNGGLTAVARACPALFTLRWLPAWQPWIPNSTSSSSRTAPGGASRPAAATTTPNGTAAVAAAAAPVNQQLLTSLPLWAQLRELSIQQLPALSFELLAAAMQLPGLQDLAISCHGLADEDFNQVGTAVDQESIATLRQGLQDHLQVSPPNDSTTTAAATFDLDSTTTSSNSREDDTVVWVGSTTSQLKRVLLQLPGRVPHVQQLAAPAAAAAANPTPAALAGTAQQAAAATPQQEAPAAAPPQHPAGTAQQAGRQPHRGLPSGRQLASALQSVLQRLLPGTDVVTSANQWPAGVALT